MSGHVWCLIASVFLTAIKAEPQSFYEFPVVSSTPPPAPAQTSPQPDLSGTKEIVLLLTPNQVDSLQAAGAVVRPFPEYGSELDQLQGELQQNVEQNGQQYQIVSASEGEKQDTELENYYKLLNIQEINDDLAQQAQAAEGTTEKPKEIPRYKYTKSRQQYKDKDNFTPYVPKKASRPKSFSENTNSEYVRFLPDYEDENLKIVPYQALPLSPYQFAELQANAYAQANAEAFQNTYVQVNQEAEESSNEESEINEKTKESEENSNEESKENINENSEENKNDESEENSDENTQKITYNQANKDSQRYAYNQANKEPQRTAYNKANKEAQRNRYTQVNKGTQRNTYKAVQRNASKANLDAQRSAYAQINKESQRNAYNQANNGFQGRGYKGANNEGKPKSYSQASKELQRIAYNQAKKESGQNAGPVRDYIPIKEEPESPEALQEILPVIAQTPAIVSSHLRALDTAELKKTLTSIDGLNILKKQQKAETPTLLLPTAQTPSDKLSLLLAPLYQHKVITDTIARKKEELLSGEQKIHSKLQQLKNAPLDPKQYATEIEKLTSNLGKQNVLAEIEAEGKAAISKTPAVLLNQESVTTGNHPVLLRVPKPLEVKIPAPYPVPLQIIRQLPTPKQKAEKVEEEKPLTVDVQRQIHVPGTTNVYVSVNNQLGQKEVAESVQQQIPDSFPSLKPEQITILRHIWEH